MAYIEASMISGSAGTGSIGRIKLPIRTSEERTKSFFTTIDGISIKLRETKSGNAYYAQLVSTTTAGTESVVNVASLTAGFVNTFTIKDLKILNPRQFIITYYWATSETANSTIRSRCITIKLDGSLLMGTELAISAVSSATLDVDAWLIPTMVNDSYISLRKQTTISSGAYLIGAYRVYMSNLTGALSANTTALINLTSDVDNYLPDMSLAPVKGGLFYKDASGVDSLLMINDYNSAGRVYALSVMGSDLAAVGSTDHYVLGMTKSGYVVTAKCEDGIYLWQYDPSSTTNLFKKKINYSFNKFRINDWLNASTLPYEFTGGSAVVYDNKIHILGSVYGTYKQHYSWNGTQWVEESTLPYNFSYSFAVVYDNKIHILGSDSISNYTKHYSWNGTQWVEESTLPYPFYSSSAVVYDNKIHILGSDNNENRTKHYSWDGTSWIEESTLPYDFYDGSAVIYNNKIHILGSSNINNYTKHYSWDGTQWTQESTLPYQFYNSSAVVYDNKIHILSGYSSISNYTKHYSWDGTQWIEESTLPYEFKYGSAVVYNDKIHILGGTIRENHYSYDKNNKAATILSFENDVITMSDGRRYQITDTQFKELEQITNINTQLTTVPHYGPESSPVSNVFIYGD